MELCTQTKGKILGGGGLNFCSVCVRVCVQVSHYDFTFLNILMFSDKAFHKRFLEFIKLYK